MLKLRWYEAQLDRLPTDSKENMSQELLRAMHWGSLPSKREWECAVQKAARFYKRTVFPRVSVAFSPRP